MLRKLDFTPIEPKQPVNAVTKIMLLAPVSLIALGEPFRMSFTNLQGDIVLNATVVKTNLEGIIFKRQGKPGFFTEPMTNLPAGVIWNLKATERAEVERERVEEERRQMALIERAESQFNQWFPIRRREIEKMKQNPEAEPFQWSELMGKVIENHEFFVERVQQAEKNQKTNFVTKLRAFEAAFKALRKEGSEAQDAVVKNHDDRIHKRREMELAPWNVLRLPRNQAQEVYRQVTNAVTIRLRAPRTAVFESPERILTETKYGKYRATGFVDSQNGFGALIRTVFVAEYEKNGDSYLVTSVSCPKEQKD